MRGSQLQSPGHMCKEFPSTWQGNSINGPFLSWGWLLYWDTHCSFQLRERCLYFFTHIRLPTHRIDNNVSKYYRFRYNHHVPGWGVFAQVQWKTSRPSQTSPRAFPTWRRGMVYRSRAFQVGPIFLRIFSAGLCDTSSRIVKCLDFAPPKMLGQASCSSWGRFFYGLTVHRGLNYLYRDRTSN